MDFAVRADHRIKLKESEKKDNYEDIARELKNKQTMEREINSDNNFNWGDRYRDCRTWKNVAEWRPYKLRHCWDRSEYWDESWKLSKEED